MLVKIKKKKSLHFSREIFVTKLTLAPIDFVFLTVLRNLMYQNPIPTKGYTWNFISLKKKKNLKNIRLFIIALTHVLKFQLLCSDAYSIPHHSCIYRYVHGYVVILMFEFREYCFIKQKFKFWNFLSENSKYSIFYQSKPWLDWSKW